MFKSLSAARSAPPVQRPNPCLLAGPGASERKGAQISDQASASKGKDPLLAGLAAGQQRQQDMSKSLPAGRSASPVQRPSPCLLAGPGASERKGAQISDCWLAQASAGKSKDLSKSLLAGRPGGRQAKAAGHVQITACWPVRAASAEAKPVPAGGPGRQ